MMIVLFVLAIIGLFGVLIALEVIENKFGG